MALKKLITRQIFKSSLALCVMILFQGRLRADPYFPFEADLTGELVEGYYFWDVSFQEAGLERIEVMVTERNGSVVFPSDLRLSLPLLRIFYEKGIKSEHRTEKDDQDSVIQLVRMIMPKNSHQLLIYPSLDREAVPAVAEYLSIPRDDVEEIAQEWAVRASKLQESNKDKRIRIVTILAGNLLR